MKITLQEILKITKGKSWGRKKDIVFEGVSIDSRTLVARQLFIAVKGTRFDGHDFIKEAVRKGALGAIASDIKVIQSLNGEFPIIQVGNTLQSLVDLAHYNRKRYTIPLIAITGANGKTTTKDMTAAVLSCRYNVLKNKGSQNNEIGLSLNLLLLEKRHQIAVMEFGTNHPGEIERLANIACANIGIITNIGPAHLEFFRTVENVFKEKTSLLAKLYPPAFGIINNDDAHLATITPQKTITFAIKNKADITASNITLKDGALSFLINKRHKFMLNSIAQHNVYNALAAICCGLIFGVDIKEMPEKLREFSFPPSRMSVLHLDDVTILDDSYNSNPSSLKAAIETLWRYPASRKILVMADMLELGESADKLHRDIGRLIGESNVDWLITLGDFSKYAAEEANKLCRNSKRILSCVSQEEVTSILLDTMAKGDVVLFKGSHAMGVGKIIENIKSQKEK